MRSLIAFLFIASTAHADFQPKYSRYAGTLGILRSGLIAESTSFEFNLKKFAPTEAGNTPWYEWFHNTTNSSGPRGDHVHHEGWNVSSGGGALDPTQGAIFDSREQFYITLANDLVMEWHNTYCPPNTASDTACTRFTSMSGNLTTGTASLYLFNTGETRIGHGHTVGDFSPASETQIHLDATTTDLTSPASYRRLLLDDGDTNLKLSNGDVDNTDRIHLYLQADGGGHLDATNTFRITSNTGTSFETSGGNVAKLCDPASGGWNCVQVDSGGPQFYVGNQLVLRSAPGANYTYQTLRPAGDSNTHLGDSGGRFLDLAVGGPVSSQVGCNSDSRGTFMPVFSSVGVRDLVQICQKLADDSYAWKTFTIP